MGKVAVFIGVAVAIGVAIVVIGGILSLDTATEERLVDVDFNLAEVKSEVMEDVVQLKRLDEELTRDELRELANLQAEAFFEARALARRGARRQ